MILSEHIWLISRNACSRESMRSVSNGLSSAGLVFCLLSRASVAAGVISSFAASFSISGFAGALSAKGFELLFVGSLAISAKR